MRPYAVREEGAKASNTELSCIRRAILSNNEQFLMSAGNAAEYPATPALAEVIDRRLRAKCKIPVAQPH